MSPLPGGSYVIPSKYPQQWGMLWTAIPDYFTYFAVFDSVELSAASCSTTPAQSAADEKTQTEDQELTAVGSSNEEQIMEVDGSDQFYFYAREQQTEPI